jgi:hypothetical protein
VVDVLIVSSCQVPRNESVGTMEKGKNIPTTLTRIPPKLCVINIRGRDG